MTLSNLQITFPLYFIIFFQSFCYTDSQMYPPNGFEFSRKPFMKHGLLDRSEHLCCSDRKKEEKKKKNFCVQPLL